ncbi:MAG: pH regulation protein F [Actinobacteria bacterium]|nr:pH regulation protein F [Actinomycetota bacterium]
MNTFFYIMTLLLIINMFLCLARAIMGPTLPDRILAIDVVETKTLIILVLIAYVFPQKPYLEVALAFALLNFSITIVVARYLETAAIKEDWKH